MSKEKISELLINLKQELEDTDLKNIEVKNNLESLIKDLNSQLVNNENPDMDDFGEKISHIIEQFEIEHPNVTELLSKLSSSLSNMGI